MENKDQVITESTTNVQNSEEQSQTKPSLSEKAKDLFQKTKELTKDVLENKELYAKKTKRFLMGNGTDGGFLIKICVYFILCVFGFVFIYPLLFMFVTSIKGSESLVDDSIKWIPNSITIWANYSEAITRIDYFGTLFNNIVVSVVPSVIGTVICCLTGYGFARFKFPFKNVLFALLLISFIIPSYLVDLPTVSWYSKLNILGSIWSYVLPASLGQGVNSVIFILIFWSNFKLLPKQLEESAKIDGANPLIIFFKIALPLVYSAIITCFIFSVVWYWNDSASASLYLNQPGKDNWVTLSIMIERYETWLASWITGDAAKFYDNIRMACSMLTIAPLLLLYFSLQRFFVESVEKSGIAGE